MGNLILIIINKMSFIMAYHKQNKKSIAIESFSYNNLLEQLRALFSIKENKTIKITKPLIRDELTYMKVMQKKSQGMINIEFLQSALTQKQRQVAQKMLQELTIKNQTKFTYNIFVYYLLVLKQIPELRKFFVYGSLLDDPESIFMRDYIHAISKISYETENCQQNMLYPYERQLLQASASLILSSGFQSLEFLDSNVTDIIRKNLSLIQKLINQIKFQKEDIKLDYPQNLFKIKFKKAQQEMIFEQNLLQYKYGKNQMKDLIENIVCQLQKKYMQNGQSEDIEIIKFPEYLMVKLSKYVGNKRQKLYPGLLEKDKKKDNLVLSINDNSPIFQNELFLHAQYPPKEKGMAFQLIAVLYVSRKNSDEFKVVLRQRKELLQFHNNKVSILKDYSMVDLQYWQEIIVLYKQSN